MSYTPTVWQNGDTITAQKMNKLENGVANAERTTVLYSTFSGDPYIPSDAPSLSGGLRWKDISVDGVPTLPLYADSELENELTLSDFQALPANVVININGVLFIPCTKRYIEQLNDPIAADDKIYASYDIMINNEGNVSGRFCGFMLYAQQGLG